MTPSFITALVWLVSANVIAMLPSKHKHWPSAYLLMTIGFPLLGWVFWENGVLIGLLVFAAAASILRWPVRYFVRWLKRLGRSEAEA